MNVENRIWEEFKQANANAICIRLYTDKQRRYNRWYNAFIAIVATAGTIFTKAKPEWAPFTIWAIAFVTIVKTVCPNLLHPEQDLCALDGIMDFYNIYRNDMEVLFYKIHNDIISEEKALDKFNKLHNEESPKLTQMNKLIRHIPKRMQKKIDNETNTYIDEVYYNKYETKESKK